MSRKLTDRCKNQFESHIRSRGDSYFQQNRIRKAVLHSQHAVSMEAHGSMNYFMSFEWDIDNSKYFHVYCTCPYYRDKLACKHIWAGLKFLDHHDINFLVSGDKDLNLVLDVLLKKYQKMVGKPLIQQVDSDTTEVTTSAVAPIATWKKYLLDIHKEATSDAATLDKTTLGSRKAYYVLDLENSSASGDIVIEFWCQEMTRTGMSSLKPCKVSEDVLQKYTDAIDREIISLLLSHAKTSVDKYSPYSMASHRRILERAAISEAPIFQLVFDKLYQSGRFIKKGSSDNRLLNPINIDIERPWTFRLNLKSISDSDFEIKGELIRESQVIGTEDILCLWQGGYFFVDNNIGYMNRPEYLHWIKSLSSKNTSQVLPKSEAKSFANLSYTIPQFPPVSLPSEYEWPKLESIKPSLNILFLDTDGDLEKLKFDIEFNYDGLNVTYHNTNTTLVSQERETLIVRNLRLERQLLEKIKKVKSVEVQDDRRFYVPYAQFETFVQKCNQLGFTVLARGKKVQSTNQLNISVTSGIDWFDLTGGAKFGDENVALPLLLQAAERGERFVQLSDNEVGVLPSEWLKRYSALMSFGQIKSSGIRFKNVQGFLLDSILSENEEVQVDEEFKLYQETLKKNIVVSSPNIPPEFIGSLRPYQKSGYAWLHSLLEIKMGGILADDMGLGKTVQVLAFLEARREKNSLGQENQKTKSQAPVLIVVPKSLIFNWMAEAAKFTPKMTVINYTGFDRTSKFKTLLDYDVVLTTYQTMRIDIEAFRKINFEVLILDEAQAIKNPDALITKASRLLTGRLRLAMTGTPVENSARDLFSILDFVNPGLIPKNIQNDWAREGRTESTQILSKALQPLILRRTKGQVLKDLPVKSEQVFYCELEDQQKKDYENLKEFYRNSLTQKIESDGLGSSKIQILAALMRLRQAACHPGLIDPSRVHESSAKLEILVEQLNEAIAGGHKALVFSQFTSFLAIVKSRLNQEGIKFEYLDGKTQDRQQRVESFQNDPSISVFLLSLKAGGTGLNLTAADYVFMLDPWWNPAVESQAIDRVHRIGQKNKVMAYKLIAKGTVEEKVLELQKKKRNLFDALVSSDETLIKKMSFEDLKLLLS